MFAPIFFFYCDKPMVVLKRLKTASEQTYSTPLCMGQVHWKAFLGNIRQNVHAPTWTEPV